MILFSNNIAVLRFAGLTLALQQVAGCTRSRAADLQTRPLRSATLAAAICLGDDMDELPPPNTAW